MRTSLYLFTLLLLVTSCKSSENVSYQETTQESKPVTSAKTYDKAELEKQYYAQLEKELEIFNEADVKFMTDMIGHHAQALIMSDLAPKNGASEAVQILAARIINAQKDEIKIMQNWLRDRKQPVPIVKIEGLNLIIEMDHSAHNMGDKKEMDHDVHNNDHAVHNEDHSVHNTDHAVHNNDHSGHMMDESGMIDHSGMVGMLSPAQMIELSEAKGKEFDRLFLTYMIQHHSGATLMVRELESSDGAMQHHTTDKLASDINVDQTTEIERMKLMLEELKK